MAPLGARGRPDQISLGPGYIYAGELGATEPIDLVTPWEEVDDRWVGLGYTETGSEFSYQLQTQPVKVAEELETIRNAPDGRTASVTFNLAQLTATNLQLAMNGGQLQTPAGLVIFEPPDLGEEVRSMLGWESEDHTERWIWRQAIMNGALKITRQKGATPASLACVFELEKPETGLRLFKAILEAPLRA